MENVSIKQCDSYLKIYNGNSTLSGYYPNGFAGGKREAFLFSKNSSLLYKTKKEAECQIKDMYIDLDDWINIDIEEQSKNWEEHNRQEFLDRSKELYHKLKKVISSLKIKRIIEIKLNGNSRFYIWSNKQSNWVEV